MRVSDKRGHVYIMVSVVHESSSWTTHKDQGRGLQLKGSEGLSLKFAQFIQTSKGRVSHPEVLQQ